MIIDSHIHLHLDSATDDPDIGGKIIRDAMRCGIGACIASHVIAEPSCGGGAYPSSRHLREANSYAAEQARRNPGRLYFLVYLNPQNPDWEQELERGVGNGAVGVKLWISLKNPHGGLEETVAVLRRAAELGLPVLLHVFNRTGGNLPGEIDMMEFAWLSRTVPECVMIAGHSGGNWRESSGMLKYCSPNVYWETGGSNPDRGMVDGILRSCPPERLLYGSDAPGRAFIPQIWKIMESSLSPADRDLVLYRNAMKIFHIPEPASWSEIAPRNLPVPAGEDEDHYCFCGKYPFDRRRSIPPEELERLLAEHGIRAAYTAELDSIFHIDLPESNGEFLARCSGLQRIRPLAVVNPDAHNWTAVLDQAVSGGFSGVWISPAFHCGELGSPRYTEFFKRCAEREMPLWVNCGFGEPRFFHPSLKLRPVEDSEIGEFMNTAPVNAYVFQGKMPPENLPRREDCRWVLTPLTDFGGKLKRFMEMNPAPGLVWGSEFPFRDLGEVREATCTQFR